MINQIKGTHDTLDLTLHNFIIDQARTHLQHANFTEITTPILESIDLFKRTLGAETDVISKEMFIIEQHPNSSERICLRPEATAPTTRAFLQHGIQQQPWKVFSHGPMFRYERPQKGRYRQFNQFNIEIIDAVSIAHDVQMIVMLERFFSERLKLVNYVLFINFLGCLADRTEYKKILQSFLADNNAIICPTCSQRATTNSMRIFDCKNSSCQELYQKAPFIADHLCQDCTNDWEQLKEQLAILSISYAYNPLLVRGLDYYNKTVFEFSSTDLGAQNAFCGGGRYELAEQCGAKKPVPSLGAAIGLERLALILEPITDSLSIKQKPMLHVVIPLSEKQQTLALLCADLLQRHNLCTETLLDNKSIKNMMNKAHKMGASFVLLLGDDEQEKKMITIKNMLTGTQDTVSQAEVITYLKK